MAFGIKCNKPQRFHLYELYRQKHTLICDILNDIRPLTLGLVHCIRIFQQLNNQFFLNKIITLLNYLFAPNDLFELPIVFSYMDW